MDRVDEIPERLKWKKNTEEFRPGDGCIYVIAFVDKR